MWIGVTKSWRKMGKRGRWWDDRGRGNSSTTTNVCWSSCPYEQWDYCCLHTSKWFWMRWAFIFILFFCYYFFSSFYCKTDRLILPWHSVLVLSSWVFKIRFPPAISLNLIVQRYKKREYPILGVGQKVCFIGLTPVCCGGVRVCVHTYRDIQFLMFLVDAGGIHVDPLLSVAQITLGRFCSFLRTVLFWLS